MESDESVSNRGDRSGGLRDRARPASVSPLPTPTLPKGGGAIRGIGEKFTANPVTGAGSLTVPIYLSPSRASLAPELSLTYDSSSGNGPFGLGWTLSLPSITRKTDKGLPRYADFEDSDTFILSGAEDLAPALERSASGQWAAEQLPPRSRYGRQYQVRRYRPRVEGLFARIERWTNTADANDVCWRSISKDNITSWYGLDHASRLQDPAEASHIFSWLICQSHDDKGNVIQYLYKREDDELVDLAEANERNRTRTAAQYISRIQYGNRTPFFPEPSAAYATPVPTDWCFELAFDYGNHDPVNPRPGDLGQWNVRPDPFSTYRSGFELRTYRRCRRVLLFHHFPSEPEILADCLIRSTDFSYAPDPSPAVTTRPRYSLLASVTQTGYRRSGPAAYSAKSLPPVEFQYTEATIDETVCTLDQEAIENLPAGLDEATYRWVDLDGEGIAGVLTEQGDRWFYKANLSPINQQMRDSKTVTVPKFAPLAVVSPRPSLAALRSNRQLLTDLSGNGSLDLALLDSESPGFYERTPGGDWEPFRAFESVPVVDWTSSNLRFVDLTGDSRADILLTEDQALSWRPSLGEKGFGSAVRIAQPFDEEKGPRLVLANNAESIFLADLSGDGLADLVRVRNGEVCYWPNLGYGRFGAKITMDGSPWFEERETFDAGRVRLADIDGSGTADLIYLSASGIQLYFNQSGNGWGTARRLEHFPSIDSSSQVEAIDLLGTGTMCLTWSSPLSADERHPMRYIDLLSTGKPHLLASVVNNLGAETRVRYAPATKFYVADKLANTPWVTRLPFPVHVVERVEVVDHISRNRFVTTYSYHHGYYDGVEREFRGFGRVDTVDTQELASLSNTDTLPPASNDDPATNLPPIVTKTWYHTGGFVEDGAISRVFEREYYAEPDLTPAAQAAMLLADTVMPSELLLPSGARLPLVLTAEEMRQACRALQGSMLRQEIYADDNSAAKRRPYSVSERNFTIELLQPRGGKPYAVFFTHERELLELAYERLLRPIAAGVEAHDPRVSHTMTLSVDPFANLLLTASVTYGRRHPDGDLSLADQARQAALCCTFTSKTYTNPIANDDHWRIPLPASASTYELLHAVPNAAVPGATNLFALEELRGGIAAASDGAHDVLFEDRAPALVANQTYRRLIASSRTLYRPDDMGDAAGNPAALLALGTLEPLALPGTAFTLAFTPGLIAQVYQRGGPLLPSPATVMGSTAGDGGGYVDLDSDGHWWVPAGRTYHTSAPTSPLLEQAEAKKHFYLPRRYEDPFGNASTVDVDGHDLLVVGSSDAIDNTTTVVNDYRVLRPARMTDANGNVSEVAFDLLGLVSGTGVMGKPTESIGDSLAGFVPDLSSLQIDALFDAADPHTVASALVGSASTRIVYDAERFMKSRLASADPTKWQPVFSCTLTRETHASDLGAGQQSAIQIAFMYSDGFGRLAQKKIQAEPGPTVLAGPVVSPRWVASGWTVFNNKGQPVCQYEPFFSQLAKGHQFEYGKTVGVSPILFYDPMERLVATAYPDHTFEKVDFTPWHQEHWDRNDTVLLAPASDATVGDFFSRLPSATYLPTWHAQRAGGGLGAAEQAASIKAAAHAATTSTMYFDALGKTFLTVVDNGAVGRYESRATFDVQGNELMESDALGRIAVINDYDLLHRPIRRRGMDAGDRWTLTDASGKPIRAWDSRGHNLRTVYDVLRRATDMFVEGTDATHSDPRTLGGEKLCEQIIYGEGQANDLALNARTRIYEHRDTSGILTNWGRNPATGRDEGYDFKGNQLRNRRRFLRDYQALPNWTAAPAMEADVFMSSTRFDALNRPIAVTSADGSIVRPSFSQGNLLDSLDVQLRGAATATAFVEDISYNARGQRVGIDYSNQTSSRYTYDAQTFRLTSLVTTRAGFPANQQVVQDLGYVFDPVGNVTHIQDDSDLQNTIYFQNRRVEPSADYTYDAVYRLVEASGREQLGLTGSTANPPAPSSYNDVPRIRQPHPSDGRAVGTYTEQYKYDAAGNLLQWVHRGSDPANPGWTRTYTHQELSAIQPAMFNNRLTRTTVSGAVALVEPYTHDRHGNTTSMPQLQAMQWDFKDRLGMTRRQAINVNDGDGAAHLGERTFYVYDAGGQRLRKVTESSGGVKTKERIYLGGFERYREFDSAGNVTLQRDTLNIVDEDRRIARVDTKAGGTSVIRYEYANHLESASLELDPNGAVVTYEEYFPYGGTSYQAGVSADDISLKRYRFCGKERDEETGFYYYGARYYPPWLGRWMQCDPAGTVDGLNPYAYTRDNPVRHIDPNGMQTRDQVLQQIKKSGKAVHVMNPATKKDDGKIDKPGQMGNVYLGARPKANTNANNNAPPPKPPPKKGAGTGGGSGKGTDSTDQAGNASQSKEGSATGDPNGDSKDPSTQKKGGDGGQGGNQPTKKSELDYATLLAHELNPPFVESLMDFFFGKNEQNTVDTGGIPGGKGSKDNASEAAQAAYAITNLIFTFLGEVVSGLKAVVGRLKGAAAFNKMASELNAVKDASEGLAGAKNTGKCFVGKNNCGFVSVAAADPVPTVGSTKVANEANLIEGLSTSGEVGTMLRERGLGTGFPDVAAGSRVDATTFLKGMPVGTKFVVVYGRTGGGIGHVINAEVTRVGLVFYDYQRLAGGARPFFSLEGAATHVDVFTTYNPTW